MTTENPPEADEYLAALPFEVKEILLDLVQIAADTDVAGKHYLMSWTIEVSEFALAGLRVREDATIARLLATVGQLLAAIYRNDAKEVA